VSAFWEKYQEATATIYTYSVHAIRKAQTQKNENSENQIIYFSLSDHSNDLYGYEVELSGGVYSFETISPVDMSHKRP
jgi:hypothetical protein